MRIAFLSDAHGNAVSTRRCLEAVAALGIDSIHFLGDVVGYLPGECEALELLETHRACCQAGNHEAMVLGRLPVKPENEAQYQHRAAASRLGVGRLAVLREWPDRREIAVGGQRVLLVHGSPIEPLEGTYYPDTPLGPLTHLPYELVVMGHTHRPFVSRVGHLIVVNAGSCGLPRDQGDAPAFAIYDSDRHTAEICRVRVAPEDVLRAYAGYPIHDAVKSCLFRVAASPVGEFVRAA